MVTTSTAINLISSVAGNESWQNEGAIGKRTYSANDKLIAAVAQGAKAGEPENTVRCIQIDWLID